jgi:hypothetical protein
MHRQHRRVLALALTLAAASAQQAHAARIDDGNLPTSPIIKNVDVGDIYMGVQGTDMVVNTHHTDATLDITYSNLAQVGNLSNLELLQQVAGGGALSYAGTLYWNNEANGSSGDGANAMRYDSQLQGENGSADVNATSGYAMMYHYDAQGHIISDQKDANPNLNGTYTGLGTGGFYLTDARGRPETFLTMAETNPGLLYTNIAGRGTILGTSGGLMGQSRQAISGQSITYDASGQETITNYSGTEVTDLYMVNAIVDISPIVLDLSHTGRLDASGGKWQPHKGLHGRMAMFDLRGNGMKMITEWVGPKQGLLVEPRPDGTIDGNALFGVAGGYNNGFEKLSVRDANHDGVLTGKELQGLSVWVDANSNGRLDKGELKSLAELGITSLSVKHKDYRSTFVMNGKQETMWDWWPTALDVRKYHHVAVAPKPATH